jgi:hypothetical protein
LAVWRGLPAGERPSTKIRGVVRELVEQEPEPLRPPSGGLVLKVSKRVLERDKQGRLCIPEKTMTSNGGTRIPAQPNGDFLWLTEAEWRSFVPAVPRVGTKLTVPTPIRDRILRFHLADGANTLTTPWRREEIRSGELTLTLEDTSPEQVRLRLVGSAVMMSDADPARAEKGYQPRLVGLLEYDVRRGRFLRFDFVALGECWGVENTSSNAAMNGPYRYQLGIAFEVVRGQDPGERLPPSYLWRNKQTLANRTEYFGR